MGSRIAFFGGSFDPPHRGHLAVALAAADAFALDRVLLAPTGRQPLKSSGSQAAFRDRVAMCALVAATDGRLEISELDAPRPGGEPNYTVDTLTTLSAESSGAPLFALLGADSFLDLPRWRDPARLLALAEWIVVSRPGSSLADLAPLGLSAAELARVHLLETVHEEVSATALRARLGTGDPCPDALLPSVSDYITRHGLYR